MLRYVVLILASISLSAGQNGAPDPEFGKVPFDDWLTHRGEAHIKWDVDIPQPQFSAHQRLLAQVTVKIDGAEFAKRRGKGQLDVFVQLTDADERQFQNHASLDLEKVEEGIRSQDITCTMSAFVLPGRYRVAVALYDTATGEHASREEKLRVDEVKDKSVAEMWRGLPAVEFIDPAEPPDEWYLPAVRGRLSVALTTRKPLQMDVILNLTPSEHLSGSSVMQNRNLGRLIPALKSISQVDLSNGSLNLELLDLSRRRVTFRQENAHGLNWDAMKASLSDAKPGVIDLKSLQHRGESAAFFVQEVARKLNAQQAGARALIILSSPVEFDSGEDLQPISTAAAGDCPVFYIRYHVPISQPARARGFRPGAGPGFRGDPFGGPPFGRRNPMPPGNDAQIDQLARTLKPLQPRVFDVRTPLEFHKAFDTILNELSRD